MKFKCTFEKRPCTVSMLVLGLLSTLAAFACSRNPAQSSADEPGSYAASDTADCLPAVTLTDQSGNPVSLASLKGKPVLVDFIYTRCPGPCETMTLKMARIADQLKDQMGSKVTIVSITLDPEHDGPEQLAAFAKTFGAARPGWLFLSGTLPQIQRVLDAYKVKRVVEANGMVDHVLEMFLLGPDGHQVRLYSEPTVEPKTVVADIRRELARS